MINKVTLIGNLGKDPEMKTLPNGTAYVRFSVATNENYQVNGEWQTKTEWHNVIIWRQAAERAAQQLKKGSMVYIEGKLTHRSWEDENGNTRYMTEVAANLFRSLDKRESSGNSGRQMPPPEEPMNMSGEKQQPTASGSTTNNNTQQESYDSEGDADDLPF